MATGLPKGRIIFKQMKQLSLKMKLNLVLITCISILNIYDEKVLAFFHQNEDSLWKLILDSGSSCVQIVLILWAFILGNKAIRRYKEKEKHYQNLIELTPEAIFVQRKGKILFTNKAGVTLLGANSIDDLLHQDWENYIYYTPKELKLINEQLNKGGITSFQVKARRLDGQFIDLEITSTSIEYDGFFATEFIARDITIEKRQERLIKQLAYQDTLTQLPNRRSFLENLDKLLTISKKIKLTLL